MAANTHAFIVRVWYEETGSEESARVRRGYVEHVGTEQHLYFEDSSDILPFIDRQVEQEDAGCCAKAAAFPAE